MRSLSLVPAGVYLLAPGKTGAHERRLGLAVQNGWYVHNGKTVWGYAQHKGWWRAGQRANITRNAPGHVGPNRTEDLDKLTDAMLQFGYPGFEHNFGLWYDRRRDRHDTTSPNTGELTEAVSSLVQGGSIARFTTPNGLDWALWVNRGPCPQLRYWRGQCW